ncbi:MAG TPA: diacylglycerol kinase family protein [Pyrinomonadaceae bacterium]|nr:diacylglycerol kinase family protein [Pyrinomonadaceae bacterium]
MPHPIRRLTLVIINRHAGRAGRLWPAVKNALERRAVAFDAHETTGPGDAEKRTRDALRNGYTTIAVLGGDGTLSECAAGFFASPHNGDEALAPINPEGALAVLPAGTGNDFARGLEGRGRSLDEWVERLLAGNTRSIDVLRGSVDGGAHQFVALNAATMGIGAEVAARVAAQRNWLRRFPGKARFALAALRSLGEWREGRVRIEIDDAEFFAAPSNLIAVANGLYAGGGMMFAPAAQIDDGYLDVVAVGDASRRMIARELTRIHRGGHVVNRKVKVGRGRSVRVEALAKGEELAVEADGNFRGRLPAHFAIAPGALRMIV